MFQPRAPGPGDPEPAPARAEDHERLQTYAEALADGIVAALAPWVEGSVTRVAEAWQPGLGRTVAPAAAEAGSQAVAVVGEQVRTLLATDVDAQGTGPLAVVREAVRYPTAVLAATGVPSVVRDEFSERAFPDDVYDLTPASFADLDPDLAEVGLVWSAAKAHVVLGRRRAEGRR